MRKYYTQMKYQQGQNREQLHIFPMSMEASISAENEVWASNHL
jgi:hypothetical protein